MQLVPYHSNYANAFYTLNIEWLETYFYVEDYDRDVLSDPEHFIIKPGGHIFFAVENETVLGTVALLKRGSHAFEITKMAVLPEARGKQVGQKLMQYCITFAKENNFQQLFLYSNTSLTNAIHIYKKYGFVKVPLEQPNPYKRSNIKMDYNFS
ncbi:GNAT family N-acetyltransferase [Rasiella sp. SM2506]|uniref:GNAT family N-acetyltransferase n=1 Tax=Rasiella sp. SM2506 TaxID=3423914 RepID=UPI003D7B0380